jgi:hypothetical protein
MPDTRIDRRRHKARKALHAEPPGIAHSTSIEAPIRYSTKSLDRAFNAHLARFALDITPSGSPGKEIQLMEKAARDVGGGQCGHLDADPRIGPRHQARRDRGQASLEAHVRDAARDGNDLSDPCVTLGHRTSLGIVRALSLAGVNRNARRDGRSAPARGWVDRTNPKSLRWVRRAASQSSARPDGTVSGSVRSG